MSPLPDIYVAAAKAATSSWKSCGSPRVPALEDCVAEGFLAVAAEKPQTREMAVTIAFRRVIDFVRREKGCRAGRPATVSLQPGDVGIHLPFGRSKYRLVRKRRRRTLRQRRERMKARAGQLTI